MIYLVLRSAAWRVSKDVSPVGIKAPWYDSSPVEFAPARSAAPAEPSAVEETLSGVNPDELTAREALDLVYRLKRLLDE